MLSEYALGTPPLPAHFPLRNRIIAGLTRGTLVVEAALQSGSLITARLAAEAGREVFAIPGSIHSTLSRGCHHLLKQGAKLVESAQDILEELHIDLPPSDDRSTPDTPPEGDPLLQALGYDPVSLDALVARTGEAPQTLNARLLELELQGRVARLPGQLFQRLGSG
jgi:DNA processing protein